MLVRGGLRAKDALPGEAGTWRRDEVGGLRLVGTGEVGGREVIFLPRKYEVPFPLFED